MTGERAQSKWQGLGPARVALLFLVLAAAALLASGSVSARTEAKAKTITVKIRDTGFALSTKKAPAGKVTFVVTNLGKRVHDFRIGSKKTPLLKHGKKARLVLTFKKAGRYAYRSTVKGDAKKLKGTFVVTKPPTPSVPGNAAAGKTVFKANCTACHTLKEAGATGTIGPNLDHLKLPDATIVHTVTNGKSGSAGTMPPFKATLSATQIRDVAAFVYAAEH